jgi:drug/metabolite transporter (DMT)-like permease
VLLATVLALASAGLHATWNLLVKTSDDRELAAWGQFVAGGLLFAPVLAASGLPHARAWPFLLASAAVHVGYVHALVAAYHHGDFSLAYPLARGGGALAAAVAGAVVLSDDLAGGAWAALVVVAVGLATLVRPGAPRGELGFALLTAAVIATYTVIDTAGARRTDDGFAYGVALTLCTAVTLTVAGTARGRARELARTIRGGWSRYAVSGLCLTGAYSLVMVAVRHAPVGYVATLRESSVVLGALLGWLVLGESLGRRRTWSSLVVCAGLVALVVLR